jgi:uncharacterized cupredoxin-like copper-binding protein
VNARGPRVAAAIVAAAAVTVLLTGCEGAESSAATGAGGHSQPAAQSTAPAQSTVKVGLFEWSIVTAPRRAAPGRLRLVVTNTGGTEHDLNVQGRNGHWETPTLDPGERATLIVRAAAGETLHLWCSEPGHRAQGMHTVLPVVGK